MALLGLDVNGFINELASDRELGIEAVSGEGARACQANWCRGTSLSQNIFLSRWILVEYEAKSRSIVVKVLNALNEYYNRVEFSFPLLLSILVFILMLFIQEHEMNVKYSTTKLVLEKYKSAE